MGKGIETVQPYVMSCQIAFRVLEPTDVACRVIAATLARKVLEREYTIKDTHIEISSEISPERRIMFRNIYEAVDKLAEANIDKALVDICYRSLKSHARLGFETVGFTPGGQTKWSRGDGCAGIGFHPGGGDAQETGDAEFHDAQPR